ncbi:uncharacterized protein [Hoplias malabaricus]|uniref:uncharacterized protein n=1 Tax=Hoplias malabaricus TaxID=27720 RepID=UPI003462FA8C
MAQESREMKYFMTAHGQTFTSHLTFLERLINCLRLREVNSLDESDIVISFVAIVSRAGTDIEAALQAMPQTTQSVVLVVLHHTFDPGFITAESSLIVNRENVFTVDCVFHEDKGLLICQRNDEALRAVTDYLKAKGASPTSQEGVRPFMAQIYLTAFCQHLQHLSLPNKKRILLIFIWIVLGMASGAVIGCFGTELGVLVGGLIGALAGCIVHLYLQSEQTPAGVLSTVEENYNSP